MSPEPDVGVTGTRFFGDLTAGEDDIWSVAGIPLTPLTDDLEYDPYPLARVTLWDVNEAVAQTVAVLPVSWEVSCKTCHYSPGITAEIDVLRDHDTAFGTTLEADRPVFCASCHYSKPMAAYTAGDPEVSTLSQAIHTSHAEYMEALGSETNYCYACHPGFEYPHQRDVHAKPHNIACGACHGQQMTEIGRVTREAWVELPRCITCHSEDVDLDFEPEGVPYKNARGHGGVLCATCHGPQHAYWPATTTQDAIQPIGLQGHSGYIDDCLVCHATEPDAPFEHRDFTAKKNRPPKWAPIPTASR
ncbi:MAG: multiheme c-type cytochrome [Deltaproteobacteria bacterium]|nr:multiheme c-type cytochrome [Deltaproteobacteria bacterium]